MNTYTLFDRVIDLHFYAKKADGTLDSSVGACDIKCPAYGPKPDISISYKQTDGVTYQIIVKVANFVPTLNINRYNALEIRAGYKSATFINSNVQMMKTITMSITNSFIEQPLPNGVWQINGIISDWFAYMEPKDKEGQLTCYEIQFDTPETTIGIIISKIVTLLGVQAHYDTKATWLNYKITVQYKKYRGTSYWATLRWLVSQLNQFSQVKLPTNERIICNTFDDAQGRVQLYIWKNGDQNYADSSESYTKIKLITSFQLDGPEANITMPYYPSVVPGSLIQVTPTYYTSSLSVSEASTSSGAVETKTDTGYAKPHMYRVLLSSVNFSTIGSTNQMVIHAVPASSYTKGDTVDTSNATNNYTAEETESKTVAETKSITIGNSAIDDTAESQFVQSVAVSYGHHFTGKDSDGQYYTLKSGDTLSSLAQMFYADKIQAINYSHYKNTKIYTKNVLVNRTWPDSVKNALEAMDITVRNTSVYATALWPLILIGTYTVARREANAKNSTTPATMSSLGYCTSILDNPDVTEIGKKVWIYTNFKSPDEIKSWASGIFSSMATFYKNNQGAAYPWRTTTEINGLSAIAQFMQMDNLPA